jgi:hypothetical protein
MTADSSVSGSRAFIAYTTYNNTSSARLTDWIDTQFGTSYVLKVYKGDPNSGGTLLPAGGSGSDDGWFFDYSSGVLNFNGAGLPSGVTDTNIYIVGYRYIGSKGVASPGQINPTNLYVSGISTFAGDVYANANLSVTGLSTFVGVGTFKSDLWSAGEFKGFTNFSAPFSTTPKVFTVTVDNKSATHRYNGTGSGAGYIVNGIESPFLTLVPGRTYRFDQADNSNATHRIRFYLEADKTTEYTNGVTINGTAGSAGAYTQIVVSDRTPTVLHYMCENHGYMGNAAFMNSNVTDTNYDAYLRANLSVTGISTFTGIIDGNGGANISGGAGLVASSAKVSDLTSGRVVIAGTSGEIEDSSNLTFNGTTLNSSNLNVSGVSTFAGNIDANGNLDVDGHTELDFVNVSAASTFAGVVDINNSVNISSGLVVNSGATLDSAQVSDLTDNRVVIAGASGELEDDANLTFNGTTLSVGVNLDVDGHTELDFANVSGIITAGQFSTGASGTGININTNTVTGPAEMFIDPAAVGDNTGKVRIKGDLYVDGTTFSVHEGDIEFGDFVVGIASTVPTNALLDGAGIGIGSTGIRKFIRYNHASTSLQSSIDFSVLDGGAFKAGTNSILNKTTLGPTVTKSSLETLGTLQDLDVTGISTFARIIVGSAVTANSTGVYVTGVTTSTSLVAGSAKVSDLTATRVVFSGTAGELEDSNSLTFDGCCLNVTGPVKSTMLNVSGVSTTGGLLDMNAGGQANTFKVEDLTAGRVVLAGTGGEIEDSANLKFTGSDLIVGTGVTANNSGVIVSGVTTSISFVGPLTGNSTTATDLSINATQRLVLQTGNNATDVLASGNAGQVLQSAGSGNAPAWVNAAAAGAIEGITVRQNGSVVGSANSISTLNFLGNAVSVDAAVLAGIATVTIEAEDPVAMAIALG